VSNPKTSAKLFENDLVYHPGQPRRVLANEFDCQFDFDFEV